MGFIYMGYVTHGVYIYKNIHGCIYIIYKYIYIKNKSIKEEPLFQIKSLQNSTQGQFWMKPRTKILGFFPQFASSSSWALHGGTLLDAAGDIPVLPVPSQCCFFSKFNTCGALPLIFSLRETPQSIPWTSNPSIHPRYSREKSALSWILAPTWQISLGMEHSHPGAGMEEGKTLLR